jgi:hypothetical protein
MDSTEGDVTSFIEIPGPGQGSGPGVDLLAAVLNAQRVADDWAVRRALSARAVIVVSAAMAYMLAVKTGYATSSARLVVVVWLLAFAALLLCGAAEMRANRRVDLLLAEQGGRRVQTAG